MFSFLVSFAFSALLSLLVIKQAKLHETALDCDFRGVAEPSIVKNVNGLKLENVRVNGRVISSLTEGATP